MNLDAVDEEVEDGESEDEDTVNDFGDEEDLLLKDVKREESALSEFSSNLMAKLTPRRSRDDDIVLLETAGGEYPESSSHVSRYVLPSNNER